jgi:hypothetical protein
MTMKSEKGMTLVETLLVSTITLLVLGATFFMIAHFGNSQKTELARSRLSEESRFMFNAFAEELKDAGAMLTLSHSNSFLSDTPYFNGIFPLDNTDGPDGIIVASGDPDGATTLTADFAPPSTTINVKSTLKSDATSAWAVGDKGIVIAKNGYYVFSVASVTATTLGIRDSSVYYSGLLSNCGSYNYTDTLRAPATAKGNALTYLGGTVAPFTPVMRLSNFAIYLFDQVYDNMQLRNVNRLFRITDTLDVGGTTLLSSQSVVSDNVYDMQLSYTFYTSFPTATPKYVFFETDSDPTPAAPFSSETAYSLIQKKYLKEINVSIVVLTDEYGGAGEITREIPAIKNRASYELPAGKYNFKLFSYSIQNKNFNIVI